MSKKRMMPKSVRIYYEQMKKRSLEQQLAEYAKAQKEKEYNMDMAYRGKDH